MFYLAQNCTPPYARDAKGADDEKSKRNCSNMFFAFALELCLSKTTTFDEPVRKKDESIFF
jgi:hypothetical protein